MVMMSLEAQTREVTGKGHNRRLRMEGRVPANIYGSEMKPVMIILNTKEITKLVHKEGFMSRLMEVVVDGKKHRVLPKELQLHPVTDFVEHVDFQVMKAGAKVHVKVPIHFHGEEECPGVVNGGIFNAVHRDIELNCDVEHIPTHIDVDVSKLDIGHSLHVDHIVLPKGTALYHPEQDMTIATIVGMAPEEEEVATAGVTEEAGLVGAEEGAEKPEGESDKE